MRISDWSSDVCSSDLIVVRAHLQSAHRVERAVDHLGLGRPAAVFPAIAQRGARLRGFGRVIAAARHAEGGRSEEHTSELQSLMRISYAVFCLKKKTTATQ